MHIGGVTFKRRSPLPAPTRDQHAVDDFLRDVTPYINYATREAAYHTLAQPPVTGGDGREASFGKLTFYRAGWRNEISSAAQLFEMARHSGRFVIAYTNLDDPEQNALHPVDEVAGVKVPPALRGKIFATGSPTRKLTNYEQDAEGFLKQLEWSFASPHLDHVDPTTANLTAIGYSKGGQDLTIARDILERAGLGSVFGKLITLGTPNAGVKHLETDLGRDWVERGFRDAGEDAGRSIRFFAPTEVRSRVGSPGRIRKLVDLAVGGVVGLKGAHNNNNILVPYGALADRLAELSEKETGHPIPNDGYGDIRGFIGKHVLIMRKHYDHTGLGQDPQVIREMLRYMVDEGI